MEQRNKQKYYLIATITAGLTSSILQGSLCSNAYQTIVATPERQLSDSNLRKKECLCTTAALCTWCSITAPCIAIPLATGNPHLTPITGICGAISGTWLAMPCLTAAGNCETERRRRHQGPPATPLIMAMNQP